MSKVTNNTDVIQEIINTLKGKTTVGGAAENKLVGILNNSVTEITADDLEGATLIKPYLFNGCSNLINIELPDSITRIGSYAFDNCQRLESVGTLPDSITSIGDYAFRYCYALTSINIPNSVTTINEGAFYACWKLESIVIPDKVTSIKTRAFQDTPLKSIFIPASVISTGSYAFLQCAPKSVYIDDLTAWCNIMFSSSYGTPFEGSADLYLNGKLLTELVIPSDVIKISDRAFYKCGSITSVVVPDNVTTIGSNAFFKCPNLTSVDIGIGVTQLNGNIFYECSNLATVTLGSNITSISSSEFSRCSKLTDIYVPWAEGAVANAPWGATKATIHYNSEV